MCHKKYALLSEEYFVKDSSKNTSISGTLKTTNSSTDDTKLDKAQCLSSGSFSPTKAVVCHPNNHMAKQSKECTTEQRRYRMQESPAKLRGILRSPSTPRRSTSSHSISPLSSTIFSPMVLSTDGESVSIDPMVYKSPSNRQVRFSFPETRAETNDAYRRLDFSLEHDKPRKIRHCRSNARGCMNDILFELDIHDFYPNHE